MIASRQTVRLAGLAVADDQLALAAADGGHRVDRLDAGQQRLADLLALDHRGRLQLQRAAALAGDLALAVDRVAQRVDDPAQVAVADRHGEDLAGAPDVLALFDLGGVTQDDHADVADVEVQGDAQRAALELEQLVGHRARQALDAGDAVAGLGDRADLLAGGLGRVGRNVALDRATDLVCGDRQLCHVCCFLMSLGLSSFESMASLRAPRERRPVGDDTLPSMTSSPTRMIKPPWTCGSTAVRTLIARPYMSARTAASRAC